MLRPLVLALCLLLPGPARSTEEIPTETDEAVAALHAAQAKLAGRAVAKEPVVRASPKVESIAVAPPPAPEELPTVEDIPPDAPPVRERLEEFDELYVPERPAPSPRYADAAMGWSIVPPAGFRLVQRGKRTVWRGPGELEVLVETERAPRGTAMSDWVDLHRRYEAARGDRYRLVQIGQASLGGRPGAVWEFDLDHLRKVDVATHAGDVGYAVMITAPRRRADEAMPLLRRAMESFRLPGQFARN